MARASKGPAGRGGKGAGAGGASAGAIRAGGAFVELYAQDEKLQQGLKAGSQKVRVWAESLKKIGTAEALSGALTGPMGIAVAGVAALGKAVFNDLILNQAELQQVTERSNELTQRWLTQFESGLQKVRDRLAEVASMAGTGAGMDTLESELANARKNLGGLESSLKGLREEYESLNTIFKDKSFSEGMKNYGLWLTGPITGGLAGEQEKLKPGLDAANAAYLAQLQTVTELQKKLSEVNDPSKSQAAMAALRAFTDRLAEETDKLTSTASNRARELQKIANQFGFGSASAPYLQAMDAVKKADVASAIEAFVKAIDSQTARIKDADLTDAEFNFKQLAEQNDWGPANAEWQRGMKALQELRIAEAIEAAKQWGNFEPENLTGSTIGSFNFGNAQQAFGGGVMGDIKKGIQEGNELTKQLIAALRGVPLARL
jgi:hypothetical protein